MKLNICKYSDEMADWLVSLTAMHWNCSCTWVTCLKTKKKVLSVKKMIKIIGGLRVKVR